MTVGGAGHQKSERSERSSGARGEAERDGGSGEASSARQAPDDSGSEGLLAQALRTVIRPTPPAAGDLTRGGPS